MQFLTLLHYYNVYLYIYLFLSSIFAFIVFCIIVFENNSKSERFIFVGPVQLVQVFLSDAYN